MEENTVTVTPDSLAAEAAKLKEQGYRFVTASAVDLDDEQIDLLYHFDKDLALKHLRLTVPKKNPVPSLSGVYFAAFLIENEIEDHFGMKFDGLAIDFGGTLYLEGEVMRTPFCKYGVVRNDSTAADGAEAPGEAG